MSNVMTSEQQTRLNSDNPLYTHQNDEVREFLAREPAAALALEEAMPVIRDVFGDQAKPLLLVAHDPDGSQYDRLLALVPVKGDIDFALKLLSLFRQRLFDTGTLSNDKISVDVELI